jgi:hypothetical protein
MTHVHSVQNAGYFMLRRGCREFPGGEEYGGEKNTPVHVLVRSWAAPHGKVASDHDPLAV